MLKLKKRSKIVASASVFAALVAVLGTIPLSKLILGSGFLAASKVIIPLVGMLFGPAGGSLAVIIGDALDMAGGFIARDAFGLTTLVADLCVVLTAALAFTGRWKLAIALPVWVLVAFFADPISVLFVGPVPFAWLHMLAFAALAAAVIAEKTGRIGKLHPFFVASVTLGALMCGHLAGTLVGQTLQVRVYHLFTVEAWNARMVAVFAVYPVERIAFAAVGSVLSIPVLRAVRKLAERGSTASE